MSGRILLVRSVESSDGMVTIRIHLSTSIIRTSEGDVTEIVANAKMEL